jgi:hypothetical protein
MWEGCGGINSGGGGEWGTEKSQGLLMFAIISKQKSSEHKEDTHYQIHQGLYSLIFISIIGKKEESIFHILGLRE